MLNQHYTFAYCPTGSKRYNQISPGLMLQIQGCKVLGLEILKYCSVFNTKQ